ncbi:F0F1 ATP synthase subunit delta, partial [Leptospira sp. Pond_2020]|nr:F0F1 ATP synthase subunit delta [Leptospira sp. Pond_2020]
FILNYYKKNNVCKSFWVKTQLKRVLDTDSLKVIKLLLIANQNKKTKYILLYYENKILQQYKIMSIEILSAFIMNKKQKQQITNKISLKLKKKIFIIKIKIKKKIMGGFIIKLKNINI